MNDFKRVMENMEQGLNVEDAVKRLLNSKGGEPKDGEGGGEAGVKGGKDGASTPDRAVLADEEQIIDLNMVKTDPEKLYPVIYYAIKRKLKEWEQSMAERPGELNVIYSDTVYSLSPNSSQITSNTRLRERERLPLKPNPESI